jgi:hypothetical protein
MPETIRVLKPFMFSHPATKGQKLTTETRFSVGEHEIEDEIANHPWIRSGADGRIESPAQAAARAAEEEQKAKEAKAEADNANAQALAAAERLKRAEPRTAGTAEELEAELNTPVSVLRAQRGQGVPAGGKLEEEATAPVVDLKVAKKAGK